MKKMLVVALLSSAFVACGGKNKGTNTPANKPTDMKTGATGGAAYGGQKGTTPDATQAQPQKDAPNPCAPK